MSIQPTSSRPIAPVTPTASPAPTPTSPGPGGSPAPIPPSIPGSGSAAATPDVFIRPGFVPPPVADLAGAVADAIGGADDLVGQIMDAIRDILAPPSTPSGTGASDGATVSGPGTASGPGTPAAAESQQVTAGADIAAILGSMFPGANGQISEEQLYAALMQERLGTLAGDAAAAAFGEAFAAAMAEMRRSDGYVPVEDAARRALSSLVDEGVVPKDVAEQVNAEAFHAAQLDTNTGALYDDRGSAEDKTVATASIADAAAKANAAIATVESGSVALEPRPLTGSSQAVTPQGTTVDGADGFLFKPQSESNGNLVVLLPKDMSGQVTGLTLQDEAGNVLEQGRGTGVHNGGREHFRFDKPGRAYPHNLTVVVSLADGSTQSFLIPNPGQRYD